MQTFSNKGNMVLLGRTAALQTYADADYCDQPSSVVYRSVSHTSEPCKYGWTDRDDIWVFGSDGLKESYVRWDSRSPHGKGQFWGKGRPL